MKEQSYYNKIRANYNKRGRLFRNNVGKAYQGNFAKCGNKTVLSSPRKIDFGLCVGSSDLIGWTEIIVTLEMVGKKIAVFTAIEVKKKGEKLKEKQAIFVEQVIKSGGIAETEFV